MEGPVGGDTSPWRAEASPVNTRRDRRSVDELHGFAFLLLQEKAVCRER